MAKDGSRANVTDCGLPGIGRVPFGLHLCHFYSKRLDLIDSLVPYFLAGLRNHERCLWMTADPLRTDEAKAEIEQVMTSMGKLLKGHLQIFDAHEFYASNRGMEGTRSCGKDRRDVLGLWLKEEELALTDGYQGLRIAVNTGFLSRQDWDDFMAFEQTVNRTLESRRIITLCSYRLIQCQATDVFEVTRNHQYTVSRREKDWEVLEKHASAPSKISSSAGLAVPAPTVTTEMSLDASS